MAGRSGPNLVVGLGNPGPQYERTRHNVGFVVADLLASRLGVRFRRSRMAAAIADARDGDRRILLAKPSTYMNDSGTAVARVARYHRIGPDAIVAVHDDLDLAFGRIRVKRGGGTAGHNGLNSMVSAIGTKEFLRVRVGIGRPHGRKDPADFVLEPFSKPEAAEIAVVLEEAADAVLFLTRYGLEAAQNRFNPVREP